MECIFDIYKNLEEEEHKESEIGQINTEKKRYNIPQLVVTENFYKTNESVDVSIIHMKFGHCICLLLLLTVYIGTETSVLFSLLLPEF